MMLNDWKDVLLYIFEDPRPHEVFYHVWRPVDPELRSSVNPIVSLLLSEYCPYDFGNM
jgi:hypothetical protein